MGAFATERGRSLPNGGICFFFAFKKFCRKNPTEGLFRDTMWTRKGPGLGKGVFQLNKGTMEGIRPLEYMERLGWTGSDVWFAHGIHFNDEELRVLAKTGHRRGPLPHQQHEALLRCVPGA